MTNLLAALIVAGSLLAGVGAAQADTMAGNAIQSAAQAGFITPHGVFDGR
jgi:hypothetical protein